mmetsp:Transcript_60492/g.129785  ORF Transcript_60492/g.129785 Transcript_60492/m.129785 type:complete len:237 (+) Transcript_60492:1141-1851(+)
MSLQFVSGAASSRASRSASTTARLGATTLCCSTTASWSETVPTTATRWTFWPASTPRLLPPGRRYRWSSAAQAQTGSPWTSCRSSWQSRRAPPMVATTRRWPGRQWHWLARRNCRGDRRATPMSWPQAPLARRGRPPASVPRKRRCSSHAALTPMRAEAARPQRHLSRWRHALLWCPPSRTLQRGAMLGRMRPSDRSRRRNCLKMAPVYCRRPLVRTSPGVASVSALPWTRRPPRR